MEQVRHFFGLKKDPFPQDVAIRDLFPLAGTGTIEATG